MKLEKYYERRTKIINNLSLPELILYREKLLKEKIKLDNLTTAGFKNQAISCSKREFLKGKRKFICMLLHQCKIKIANSNKLLNCTNFSISKEFMWVAREKLSISMFEMIYAKASSNIERNIENKL